METIQEERTVHVVFTKTWSKKSVTLADIYEEPKDPSEKPDVIHPTRLTQWEWDHIMGATTDKVQQVISIFFTV